MSYRVAVTGAGDLLPRCRFPASGATLHVAVSGGPDSVGLTLLAHQAGHSLHLHHVNHHLRADSDIDAGCVRALAERLGVPVTVHDVTVDAGKGVEAGARAARRAVLPIGAITGHTMDDLAETIVINLLRGAGRDGLSPMVGSPTKPLLLIRRSELRAFVEQSGVEFVTDATNDDLTIVRNDVRHSVIPVLNRVAGRDVVPILARQAYIMAEESSWLDEMTLNDRLLTLENADCRELRMWHPSRLARWIRLVLLREDVDGVHPPTAAEVERVMTVIRGEATATELEGGRRVARHRQVLSVSVSAPATLRPNE